MASNKSMVVPYVVPSSYPLGDAGWSRPLGHGVHVVLAEHRGQLISSLTNDDLKDHGIASPEALLVFAKGTAKQRKVMRERIRDAEADHRKPTTWELFELTAAGVQPFTE